MAVKKKVLVGGVFDILHYGHIHFLKQAKSKGNYLVVAIESDVRVKKLKGNSRPFHNQEQRREILESLNFIDEVLILRDEMQDKDYLDLVKNVSPSVIAVTKGDILLANKKAQAKTIGARVIEVEKVKVPSTTQIAKLLGME